MISTSTSTFTFTFTSLTTYVGRSQNPMIPYQDEWKARLQYGPDRRKTMTFSFWSVTEPTTMDLVSCILSDIGIYENEEIEELYPESSPMELQKLETLLRNQTNKFERLVGDDFDSLVYDTNDEEIETLCI